MREEGRNCFRERTAFCIKNFCSLFSSQPNPFPHWIYFSHVGSSASLLSLQISQFRGAKNIFRSRVNVRGKEGEVREKVKGGKSIALRKSVVCTLSQCNVKTTDRSKRMRNQEKHLNLSVIKTVTSDFTGSSSSQMFWILRCEREDGRWACTGWVQSTFSRSLVLLENCVGWWFYWTNIFCS